MKIAVITDTHFGVRNDSLSFIESFDRFYSKVFFPTLEKLKIQTVFHLGDMFDRRKYLNYLTFSEARHFFFEEIHKRNINMHALVGNHDIFYKNKNDINSLNLLLGDYRSCVQIYEQAETIEIDGTKILFVPWIAPANYEHTMEKIKTTEAQVAMGHLELLGFQMYKDAIPSFVGVNRNVFSKFEIVASGHFHHPSRQDNVQYLGAPYEMVWSDYEDSRGFSIFDTETRQFQYVPNPYQMFYKLTYDEKEIEDFDSYFDKLKGMKGTYVKVIAKDKNNPYLFDQFIERIEAMGVTDLQVVDEQFSFAESDSDIIDVAEDTITMISKVVEQMEGKLDRNHFDQLIRELYTEALNIS